MREEIQFEEAQKRVGIGKSLLCEGQGGLCSRAPLRKEKPFLTTRSPNLYGPCYPLSAYPKAPSILTGGSEAPPSSTYEKTFFVSNPQVCGGWRRSLLRDTPFQPETEAAITMAYAGEEMVPREVCARLEIERNAARKEA